jgi:hypothetical protein
MEVVSLLYSRVPVGSYLGRQTVHSPANQLVSGVGKLTASRNANVTLNR